MKTTHTHTKLSFRSMLFVLVYFVIIQVGRNINDHAIYTANQRVYSHNSCHLPSILFYAKCFSLYFCYFYFSKKCFLLIITRISYQKDSKRDGWDGHAHCVNKCIFLWNSIQKKKMKNFGHRLKSRRDFNEHSNLNDMAKKPNEKVHSDGWALFAICNCTPNI